MLVLGVHVNGVSLRQRVCRRHAHVLGQRQRRLLAGARCMCLVANPSITPLTSLGSARPGSDGRMGGRPRRRSVPLGAT